MYSVIYVDIYLLRVRIRTALSPRLSLFYSIVITNVYHIEILCHAALLLMDSST